MRMVSLFGCGIYIKKFISILNFVEIKIIAIADNDRNKIGEQIEGIPIIAPDVLLNLDCMIIISCPYVVDITKQLNRMGMGNRIKGLREIIFESCFYIPQTFNKKYTIGIDLFSKAKWGGAEIWSCQIARALLDSGEPTLVFASSDVIIPENIGVPMVRFLKSDSISDMINIIKRYLPLVFINSFSDDVHSAVLILKTFFPNAIRCIDIVHNDTKITYDRHCLFQDFTDIYICVSKKIREIMIDKYLISPKKVFYAGQPILIDTLFNKKRIEQLSPIRIGYASRLEKIQKRADLLLSFIDTLDEKDIEYILEIAGDGECFSIISNYIESRDLSDRVRLLGRLDNENMKQFWMRQDIYISFSEFEGCSLSMLEAMNYGCVPIVTDVSGVHDYILNGNNGYICNAENMDTFTQPVKELFCDREKLIKQGEKCRKIVIKKCEMEKYIHFLKRLYNDLVVY